VVNGMNLLQIKASWQPLVTVRDYPVRRLVRHPGAAIGRASKLINDNQGSETCDT
jgi:hypothetical protein